MILAAARQHMLTAVVAAMWLQARTLASGTHRLIALAKLVVLCWVVWFPAVLQPPAGHAWSHAASAHQDLAPQVCEGAGGW
jgi:hypothetical protein